MLLLYIAIMEREELELQSLGFFFIQGFISNLMLLLNFTIRKDLVSQTTK